MDKETYDSLPLTKWLDKSGKPTEDHLDLPTERQETTIMKRKSEMLKSKTVGETLEAKGYDLDEVETGKATVRQDLMRVFEKLADDKPVVSTRKRDKKEISIIGRKEVSREENPLQNGEPENKEVLRTLVENIPEDKLKQTTLRGKIVV